MNELRTRFSAVLMLVLIALVPSIVLAQMRLAKEGVVLYWGLVPAAVVSQQHALQDMHGGPPAGGGQVHHLVVALFDAQGKRIENAVLRAQLSESGIVDAPPRYLTPMSVDGQMSYGQVFTTAKAGPYRFRVFVRLSGRSDEIEFALSAWSPHREER